MKRILVADDLEANRFLLTEALAGDDVEILEAASGEETLAIIATRRPDLVLLDVRMPGLDGIETSRRIKAEPGTPIHVILLSGHTHLADGREIARSGADGFIGKPFTVATVREAVAKVLELPRRGG